MSTVAIYRKATLLVTYYDSSELLYLPDEKRYVWMRPNGDRTKMHEVRINASCHQEAVLITRARINIAYGKRNTTRFMRKEMKTHE